MITIEILISTFPLNVWSFVGPEICDVIQGIQKFVTVCDTEGGQKLPKMA